MKLKKLWVFLFKTWCLIFGGISFALILWDAFELLWEIVEGGLERCRVLIEDIMCVFRGEPPSYCEVVDDEDDDGEKDGYRDWPVSDDLDEPDGETAESSTEVADEPSEQTEQTEQVEPETAGKVMEDSGDEQRQEG